MNATIEKTIGKLSVEELLELKSIADDLIVQQQVGKKQEVESQLREQAAQAGYPIKEIIWADEGGRKRRGRKVTRRKYPAKYQNPANPAQTWSGQGRKPAWVKSHLEQGGVLDGLAIR